ncbi:MAG TPA: hypothetical protein PLD57_11655 [Aggregatilineales bacterium]|nr:hypothetical protein [Aggregatilineales bacterium]
MNQTAALYQLQTLDSQIDTIRARLAEIERLLSEDAAVRRAQVRLDRATSSQQKWRTRLTDLELERRRLHEEAESIEQRLYSGKVLNPRELTDMQGKLHELRQRHEGMEEPVIEAMLEIEAGEEAVQEARAHLERVTAERTSALGELTEERQKLLDQLAGLEQQVASARAEVEPKYLAQYDRLRKRPGGLAVSALNHNAECSACGMQVTTSMRQQVRHGSVIACPTCQRILYHP